MARRPKYTDAERKVLKKLRNRKYYYTKVLRNLNEKMNDIQQSITESMFNAAMAPTLQSVRSLMGDLESGDPLLELIQDDTKYFSGDFRQHLLDKGLVDEAEDLSRRAGLEPLAEWIAKQSEMDDNAEMLSRLSERADVAQSILDEVNKLLKGLVK